MLDFLLQLTIGIALIATIVFGLHLIAALNRHRRHVAEKYVVLCICVSRTNERLPIVAEQMFAVLHGTYHHVSFADWLMGREPESFSFEIAHVDGLVKFFVRTPQHLKDFVESQIYAQYPDVEIEVAEDYLLASSADIHDANGVDRFEHALGAELIQTDPEIYPIKRHSQFEDKITRTAVDPLAGITSVLARLPHAQDRAMIQMVIRPIDPEIWRIKATKCARILGKNIFLGIESLQKYYAYAFMTRRLWLKVVFFPFYFIMWLQGLFAGTKMSMSAESGGEESVLEETQSSSHDKEAGLMAVMDKVVKLSFDVSIRVLYIPVAKDRRTAETKVRELAGAFKQFNQPHLNGFKTQPMEGRTILERARGRVIEEHPMVLNTEELATMYHMPTIMVKTPNVYAVSAKKLEPPVNLPSADKEKEATTLGKTNYRGYEKVFAIRQEDRRRHVYVIGKTGMGKSTLLENMILSDIQAGRGVAIVDPHGDLCEHVLDNIPKSRTNDVIVFDPSDRDFPVAFNMLENIDPAMNTIVASGLVGIFKKIYAESWGPRLEHILRNTILSLLEYPNTTMLGIPRILADQDFRRKVVRKISDPIVKRFWEDEFETMRDQQRVEAISPIQNKVGQFLSSPIIRNIVGQPKSQVNLRFAMDTKKIFVCNLSKGKIGEDNSSLLGSMIITKFQLDAMSRANIPEKDRTDFYLYVDEFQNFATESFATILSEARKYRLNLTMANQYVAQMEEEVQEAVFGNVGTIMAFQVGADDAEYLSNQFGGEEVVAPGDFVQLPKYNLYTKLLVDGMPTPPFSAATMPPIPTAEDEDRREKVIKLSRERYAQKREMVEDKIRRWSETEKEDDSEQEKAKGQSVKDKGQGTRDKAPETKDEVQGAKDEVIAKLGDSPDARADGGAVVGIKEEGPSTYDEKKAVVAVEVAASQNTGTVATLVGTPGVERERQSKVVNTTLQTAPEEQITKSVTSTPVVPNAANAANVTGGSLGSARDDKVIGVHAAESIVSQDTGASLPTGRQAPGRPVVERGQPLKVEGVDRVKNSNGSQDNEKKTVSKALPHAERQLSGWLQAPEPTKPKIPLGIPEIEVLAPPPVQPTKSNKPKVDNSSFPTRSGIQSPPGRDPANGVGTVNNQQVAARQPAAPNKSPRSSLVKEGGLKPHIKPALHPARPPVRTPEKRVVNQGIGSRVQGVGIKNEVRDTQNKGQGMDVQDKVRTTKDEAQGIRKGAVGINESQNTSAIATSVGTPGVKKGEQLVSALTPTPTSVIPTVVSAANVTEGSLGSARDDKRITGMYQQNSSLPHSSAPRHVAQPVVPQQSISQSAVVTAPIQQQYVQPVTTPQQSVAPAEPPLTPEQQVIVENYTIYYQQHYHLPPAHARAAALHALWQQMHQGRQQ